MDREYLGAGRPTFAGVESGCVGDMVVHGNAQYGVEPKRTVIGGRTSSAPPPPFLAWSNGIEGIVRFMMACENQMALGKIARE